MVAWPYPLSACCLLPVPSGTTAPDRELSPQAAPCLYLCRSEEKDGPPRFLGNPCMDMPCSSTPAALPCQAIRQGRVAFQHLKTVGDCHYHNFGALSHGLSTRCVRFAAAVTRHHATLAAGWWLALAGWDFHPLGYPTPRNTRCRLVASLGRVGLSPTGFHDILSTFSVSRMSRLCLAHSNSVYGRSGGSPV